MQVSMQKTGALERQLQIAVPEEEVSSQVQSKLEHLSKTTRVQGFRPGKVPMKVIRSRFGEQVRSEVVSQVVQSSFQDAVTQENLRPAGMPTIDPINADAGQGVSYTATFEVYPDLQLADVANLEIERQKAVIKDDDIEKMIGLLQKQNATLQTVDREAVDGDTLTIDFVGKIDGEAFEGGSAEGFNIELGSQRLIEGFEQGLIGAKAGETRELELTFPENYQKTELAGKPSTFSVTVQEVKAPELPELDAEFFKIFGVSEGGMEAFRNEVRANMEREAAKNSQNHVRETVLDKLFEMNQIELPKVMVENESQNLHKEMQERFRQQGRDPAQLTEMGPDTFAEQAKKRVTLQLVLSDIIKQNELKADPDKVRFLIEQHASNYEDPSAIVNWYYGDKQRLAEVEALALEGEVIEWVLSRCKIKDVENTFDEIMNTGQTGIA